MQAVEIQRMLYQDCLDKKTRVMDRSQAARAWEVLEERKRILRMKPKPKDVDTTKPPGEMDMKKVKRVKVMVKPLELETPPAPAPTPASPMTEATPTEKKFVPPNKGLPSPKRLPNMGASEYYTANPPKPPANPPAPSPGADPGQPGQPPTANPS